MSEVLEVLGRKHLRVRCACGCIYETNTDVWNARRLRSCAKCKKVSVRPTADLETLLGRLRAAGEMGTAEGVAARRGLEPAALLRRRGPRDRLAGAIVDLYLALKAKGHGHAAIGRLTGRDASSVRNGITYRLSVAFATQRRAKRSSQMRDERLVRRLARELLGPKDGLSLATRALAARAASTRQAGDEAAE